MFYNKNGLKINLNFDQSLNENEISKIEEGKMNKNIIRKESFVYFSQTSKSIGLEEKKNVNKFLRKHSYNFPIISKLKMNKEYIINKTLKFQILKSTNKLPKTCKSLEIIKINDINIFGPKKIIETENKNNIKEVKEDKSMKEKKLFRNLNSFNINDIFIKGKEKNNHNNNIIDIQRKISDIEFLGEFRKKTFEITNISSKVSDIIITHDFPKKVDLELFKGENIEIKPDLKQKISKENIIEIDLKNVISFQISGINILKEEKEKMISIQSNIINFEIINKAENKFKNLFNKRIISFEIKTKKKKKRKKSPHLVLKKVEGFNNINNKLFNKELNNKEMQFQEDKGDNVNVDEKKDNKNKEKIDKFKTKSPNHLQIKIKNNGNQDNNINFNIDDNKNSNINKLKINKIIASNKDNKSGITINTINNEIIYNKHSIDFPIINTDILHFEEQYEKIKKDLNELYPIFNRNKKYRENFFFQLSQGNKDKYNFYIDLFDIIKDEQEAKNNNHFKNYLKMKKILGNKNIALQNNKLLKNKLRPLKKNKSSHFIFARDKIKPLFTDL